MSSISNLETTTSLHVTSNQSLLINKKISKIRKNLLNLEKDELISFCPLKVNIYKEKKNQNHKSEIKIPITFKQYFEDFKINKDVINKIESGDVAPFKSNSDQIEQVDSSDLVNSE